MRERNLDRPFFAWWFLFALPSLSLAKADGIFLHREEPIQYRHVSAASSEDGLARKSRETLQDGAVYRESNAQSPLLQFRSDGTFKILMVADLHFGENSTKDDQAMELHRSLLEFEDPDFVVFGGDQVSGWFGSGKQGWLRYHWDRLTSPVRERGVPYAIILGNHDDEADASRREIIDIDIEIGQGLSLTRQGPEDVTGASNYWLDVASSSLQSFPLDTAARLWFFDSMNRGCRDMSHSWGCVGEDTLAWLMDRAGTMQPVPSMGFVHIPVPQLMKAWDTSSVIRGIKGELNNCPAGEPVDGGLFDAAKSVGIQALFSGHDHNNDYIAMYDGVTVGYNRKSGVGGYGPSGRQPGARVLVLREGYPASDVDSWIVVDGGREWQLWSRRQRWWAPQEECRSSAIRVNGFLPVILVTVAVALDVLGGGGF